MGVKGKYFRMAGRGMRRSAFVCGVTGGYSGLCRPQDRKRMEPAFAFMPLYSIDKVLLFLVLDSWGRCKAQGKVTQGACNCISEKWCVISAL